MTYNLTRALPARTGGGVAVLFLLLMCRCCCCWCWSCWAGAPGGRPSRPRGASVARQTSAARAAVSTGCAGPPANEAHVLCGVIVRWLSGRCGVDALLHVSPGPLSPGGRQRRRRRQLHRVLFGMAYEIT